MSQPSTIRYAMFPRTQPPPAFVADVVEVFRAREDSIGTELLSKGLTSDQVLSVVAPGLAALGFEVERAGQNIHRPVFFGENGEPTLRYEIDGYHAGWRCGIEVEAGRALSGGNAFFRDLIQAAVMVDVEVLMIAVPNAYRFNSGGKPAFTRDYEKCREIAEALYGHQRLRLPYQLVLIGY